MTNKVYTFTPDNGQCANDTTMTIQFDAKVTPIFDQIDPIYYDDNLNLPMISLNGISGTWSPDMDNTTTTIYTFTPYTGECAVITTMTIEVIQPIGCTQLIYPFDGTTDIKTDTYLKWDAIPNASGYYLSIGTYSGGNDILNSEEVTDNIYRDAILDHNTTYYVTVITYDENGEDINCTETSFTTTFKIPKFFTPNGDNINDYWNILDDYNLVKHIYIFDRFGKIMTKILPNNSNQWDGTYNGKLIENNDYWYLIQYKNGKQLKGNFTLKR